MNTVHIKERTGSLMLSNILREALIYYPKHIIFHPSKFIAKWDTTNKVMKYDSEIIKSPEKVYLDSDWTYTDSFYIITPGRKKKYLGIIHIDKKDSESLVSDSFRKSFAVIISISKYPKKCKFGIFELNEVGIPGRDLSVFSLSPLMLSYITKAINETENLNPIRKNIVIGDFMTLARGIRWK